MKKFSGELDMKLQMQSLSVSLLRRFWSVVGRKGALTAIPLIFFIGELHALPAKIIILRHGEKSTNSGPSGTYGLCSVGWSRSVALSSQYLGKDASETLLPRRGPAAFFAITPHTIELASPSVLSWGVPLQTFSAVQLPLQSDEEFTSELNLQTQRAAADVMKNPRWNNKVVVMIWEHKHIADSKLEKESKEKVTLRQLLNLDQIPGNPVPASWEGENYDFFWTIEYRKRSSKIPTRFSATMQTYPDPTIPSNAWGQWVDLPSDCKNSPPPTTISASP